LFRLEGCEPLDFLSAARPAFVFAFVAMSNP
jgi:hypothetical protein